MRRIVDFAISHARLTLALLAFLVIAGLSSYVSIPKEASPDVQIPIIYIQLSERGISPEDAERLLVRPVETQVKGVANLKEMRSAAFEGGGITNWGVTRLIDSTVVGNTATGAGGGIDSLGQLLVENSTIAGNSAGADGGGIFAARGPIVDPPFPPNLPAYELLAFNSTITGTVWGYEE